MQYSLVSVITAVDAVANQTLEQHYEAVKQVAVADRIMLTKVDLLDAVDPGLEGLLRKLAPSVPITRVVGGAAAAEWFRIDEAYSINGKSTDVEAWLASESVESAASKHHHQHDLNRHGEIEASCITFDQPVDASLFESCLSMLMEFRGRSSAGEGIVNVIGMDRPIIIHGVQHVFHPQDSRTVVARIKEGIVVIGRELAKDDIKSCFRRSGWML